MKLTATPEAYDRSVGRYGRELAPRFAAFAGISALPSGPVLDVGCGTGALTAWLAQRVGGAAVTAVDPAEPFAAVCRERVPGADVRVASAEQLPFRDRTFQAALAQLVLAFVADPPRAAAEMRRVVRPGGPVATCLFEAGGFAPARLFWEVARAIDPALPDEARLPLRSAAGLAALWSAAKLSDVRTGAIDVDVDFDHFDDLWSMFTSGVGLAGTWFVAQPEDRRVALREAYLERLGRPRAGFSLPARVVAVVGRA